MQLMTNLTPEELRQGIKLNRSNANWWRLSLTNLSSGLFLIVAVWTEIARAVEGNPIDGDMLLLALCSISFLWLDWFRTKRAIENSAQTFSDLKATASMDATGVHVTAASGATSFSPWSDFSGWKEGADVFTLTTGKIFRIFSKRGLGVEGEEEVRSLLRSNVS